MFSAGRVIFLIVFAVAFLIAPPTTRTERIRTAVPGLNLNYLSVFTAEERGFFWNEGLEHETIVIGGPAGIAALVSGDVDYSCRRLGVDLDFRDFGIIFITDHIIAA